MKKRFRKNKKLIQLLCFTAALFLFSCTGTEKRNMSPVELKQSYPPPDTVLLDTMPRPKTIDLINVPKPQVVQVPKTSSGFYYRATSDNSKEKIELKPPGIVKAQLPLANFTNFNSDNELPSNSINYGMMDKKGQLWFSGISEIFRYDGLAFTRYSIGQGGSTVTQIIDDKAGNLWIGTLSEGVFCYNGISFSNFNVEDGLPNNYINCIFEDKAGNLWFGTNDGISRYDGNQFKTFTTKDGLADNIVYGIAEDKNGNLWFGTIGGGVSRYDGKIFTTFTTEHGLANNYVLSITADRNGNLWFATWKNGVSRYDGKQFTNFNSKNGLASDNINHIVQDKEGNIWFACIGAGVSCYDGKIFKSFNKSQGLTNNDVLKIIQDKNMNLWFVTQGGGVSRLNGTNVTTLTEKQGIPQDILWSVKEDKKGNLWFGTQNNGAICYDGINFINYSLNQGLFKGGVGCIEEDKDANLWFGTFDGVNCFDGKKFTNYTTKQGLALDIVLSIMQDSHGDIWFGTDGGGVSHFNGKIFTTYTSEQGLAHNTVNCITEDPDGSIWFGTNGGGVSRYDGRHFINYTSKQGLAHNAVNNILLDKNDNLWFGTAGGVSRYDRTGFNSFTTKQGLSDNYVSAITQDGQGVIWLGTGKGLTGLKFKNPIPGNINTEAQGAGLLKETNEQLKSWLPVWEIYNNNTGYPIKDFNDRAIYITKRGLPFGDKNDTGIIWGACRDQKIIRFDRKPLFKNPDPLPVFIHSIKVGEEDINWYGLNQLNKDSVVIAQQDLMTYNTILSRQERDSLQRKFGDIQFDSITPFNTLPLNLVLPYKHNQLSFDFGAIETSRNFMVRYQYMLEGYDKEWSPVSEKTSASFGNISEGSYTFKLKARSPEGVWSEPIEYTFKVLPPWWRTWWFRTIEGISLLLLLYSIYRWRTAALHKQKRVLEKTVKERTAEVVKQKEKSDELLLNILPSEVADELKEKGYTTAKSFDDVTVLFSDIKGFTNVAEKMTAQELVKEINTYFSIFDHIIQQYGLEKIKTIGDAYIAAGGLPEKNSATAQNVVEAAIAMQQAIEKLKKEKESLNKPYFELRIGIHTGPVVAGVVGIKKFQYDIWGDTVNLAARMEQSGVPGKINISQHTYEIVKNHFNCVHRGKIEAKNKGEIDMYFVG